MMWIFVKFRENGSTLPEAAIGVWNQYQKIMMWIFVKFRENGSTLPEAAIGVWNQYQKIAENYS